MRPYEVWISASCDVVLIGVVVCIVVLSGLRTSLRAAAPGFSDLFEAVITGGDLLAVSEPFLSFLVEMDSSEILNEDSPFSVTFTGLKL